KIVRGDVRHRRRRRQVNARDRKPTVRLLEIHLRRRANPLDGMPRLAQLRRQRHRETPRMRRGNEVLGIRARIVLKPRLERIRPLIHAALKAYRPVTLRETPVPFGFGTACRHTNLLGAWVKSAPTPNQTPPTPSRFPAN